MLDLFSQFANYETLFGALLRWGSRQDIVRQQIDERILDDGENILHGGDTKVSQPSQSVVTAPK